MSFYLFVYILSTENVMLDWGWLRTTFWREDSYKAQNTKNELRKKQEKKQRFLGINKKLFIFPQVFFSKKKIKLELRHLQKWDKLSLQVTIFKQACCFIEFKLKEKKERFGMGYSIRRTEKLWTFKEKNSLKLWTEKWMEIPFKPLITLCVFLRRQHHLC